MLDSFQKNALEALIRSFSQKKWKRPDGFYLYGPVGRGKSLVMNLFLEAIHVSKIRFHNRHFLYMLHKTWNSSTQDFLQAIMQLIRDAKVVAFDEVLISDVVEASLFKRVWNILLKRVFVVCTSNTAPHNLYLNGFKREDYLSFFSSLEKRMIVFHLDGGKDYRLQQALPSESRWPMFTCQECHTIDGRPFVIQVYDTFYAKISFSVLFQEARGFADYQYLGQNFHVILIEHTPMLDDDILDQVYRFISCIDILYDMGKIVDIDHTLPIYQGNKLSFQFMRISSRLHEMKKRLMDQIKKNESFSSWYQKMK